MFKITKQTIAVVVLSVTTLATSGGWFYTHTQLEAKQGGVAGLQEIAAKSKQTDEVDKDPDKARSNVELAWVEGAGHLIDYKTQEGAPSSEDVNEAMNNFQQHLTALADHITQYGNEVQPYAEGKYESFASWGKNEYEMYITDSPVAHVANDLVTIASYAQGRGIEIPPLVDEALQACYNMIVMPAKETPADTVNALRHEMNPLTSFNQYLSNYGFK